MKTQDIKFPFKCRLSLSPLIEFWERLLAEGSCGLGSMAPSIRQQLESVPMLRQPIDDPTILEQHQGLIDMLMTIVFPPAFREDDCAAAFVPFQFTIVYATPAFKTLFKEGREFVSQLNINPQEWGWGKTLRANTLILRKIYGMDLDWDYPLVARSKCPKTGLDRFFNIILDPKFLEIKALKEPRILTEEDRARLLANVTDLAVWRELIPPEDFEIQGFGVFRAMEVTAHKMISALRADLFEEEAIFQRDGFASLQEKLQIYLQEKDIELGLAAIREEQIFLLPLNKKRPEKGCVLEQTVSYKKDEFKGSIFTRAMDQREPLVIEDLQNYPESSSLEEGLRQSGYRSVYVAPLQYQDRLLGVLVLKSTRAGALNALNTSQMYPVLPLFAVALNRSLEQLNQRIQTVIKEECTAIHPSVEWRFQKAALNYIQSKKEGVSGLEPIVFEQVYPLFGVSDIRMSSDHRNAAIQADLIEHFQLVKGLLQLAHEHRQLPILASLTHRIDKQIKGLEVGLQAGDESTKLYFIQQVIEPIFDHLGTFGPLVQEKIAAYRTALDPQTRTIYRSRRQFEESLKLINETVATFLDQEEDKAQGYFPHYFEKRKTDGVEHTIYIGASMVEDGKFCPMYLKNLRLWQLMVMCEVVRLTESQKGKLSIPLETTHLILVQDSPLSIRFSPDERHFEVEGAYDIRHEIIKKRIDKAMIKGTSERLTQPGKIAIVYSNRQEAAEYLEYIDYLQAAGYLRDEMEDVELQELQGAQGLSALRVTVATTTSRPQDKDLPDTVTAAVKALPQRAKVSS
ncbi:MAG: GAF domain-containing protein [Syntrophobacterales bacterium]